MGICIYERNAGINMRLQNELWMIKFLLKKKWIWVLTLTIGMYFVLLPYQQNLLDFFGNLDRAKILFWRGTYLYHNVFVLIFVFHAAVQLLNIELFELHMMWKVQIRFVLCGVFILYQILAIPAYLWYVSIYPNEVSKFLLLVLTQMITAIIFYVVSAISKKTILGFVIVLTGILLLG